MKYEGIKQFTISTKTSKSTIYRFYKKNIDLWAETKMSGKKRVYPKEHARYFSSELMFDENVMLRQENKSLRNLIDCLADESIYQQTFWKMDWTFFGTIAYKSERKKISCYKQMTGLFNHLNNLFGGQTKLRLFFTCEPFTNRVGYHNHFVLYVENQKLQEQVYSEIESYFEFDRVDVKYYDRYKAAIFYISKEGLSGEDWDYLDNTNQQPESDEN